MRDQIRRCTCSFRESPTGGFSRKIWNNLLIYCCSLYQFWLQTSETATVVRRFIVQLRHRKRWYHRERLNDFWRRVRCRHHEPNISKKTPLHLHCQRRNASVETAQLLLSAYPDAAHARERSLGYTPFHFAAACPFEPCLDILIRADPLAAVK